MTGQRQIQPAPTDDFEVGKTGLPNPVYHCGFISELTGRFHHDKGRAGDQVMCLQQAADWILERTA